jgi:hypothetical protein
MMRLLRFVVLSAVLLVAGTANAQPPHTMGPTFDAVLEWDHEPEDDHPAITPLVETYAWWHPTAGTKQVETCKSVAHGPTGVRCTVRLDRSQSVRVRRASNDCAPDRLPCQSGWSNAVTVTGQPGQAPGVFTVTFAGELPQSGGGGEPVANPAFVASSHGSVVDGSSGTTVSTNASVLTAGNANLAWIRFADPGSAEVVSVQDLAGNNYAFLGMVAVGSDEFEVWLIENAAGHASNVVTATLDQGAAYRSIVTTEYTNVPTSGSVMVIPLPSYSGVSGTLTTNTFNTTDVAMVVFGAQVSNFDSNWTPASGYTFRQQDARRIIAVHDRLYTTSQTGITASVDVDNGSPKAGLVVVFLSEDAGGGDQALAGAHIASTGALFSPTIGLTLQGAHIASTAVVNAPALAQNILGAHIASTSALNAGTISQNLEGATIASTAQLFAPSLAGVQVLVGAHIGSTAALFAPALHQQIQGATIASTAALFAPSAGLSIAGATIASSSTLYAPSVTLSLVGSTIASTSTLHAPTISQQIQGAHISSTAQLFEPVIALDGTVVTEPIASTSQMFAPSLTMNVLGGHIGSTSSMFAPTISFEQAIAGAHIPSTAALYGPTASLSVAGAHIPSTAQVFAPTVSQGLAGGTIASTSVLFAPTIGLTIQGATIPSTGILFQPTAAVANPQTLAGAFIASGSQVFAPAIAVQVPFLPGRGRVETLKLKHSVEFLRERATVQGG